MPSTQTAEQSPGAVMRAAPFYRRVMDRSAVLNPSPAWPSARGFSLYRPATASLLSNESDRLRATGTPPTFATECGIELRVAFGQRHRGPRRVQIRPNPGAGSARRAADPRATVLRYLDLAWA